MNHLHCIFDLRRGPFASWLAWGHCIRSAALQLLNGATRFSSWT